MALAPEVAITQHGRPDRNEKSTMRRFLTEFEAFTWPSLDSNAHHEDDRRLHLEFSADFPSSELLLWERDLIAFKRPPLPEQLQHVFIDQYRANPAKSEIFRFPEAFAVKKLANKGPKQNKSQTNDEVQLMNDLRFPHVTALLGTFSENGRLHILTYPAGCCDLGDFMHCISRKLQGSDWQPERQTSTPDVYSRSSWLFREPLSHQLVMVRGYFVCLCEALSYLHRSWVRHKDIKPENIIIDATGNVVLIDFGISTQFERGGSFVTQDINTPSTSKYRPPEKDQGLKRDERSDIWMLGCVFLEMMTLLMGKTLEECELHCGRARRKDEIEKFCADIEAAWSWLEVLRQTRDPAVVQGHEVKDAIPTVRTMLSQEKENRPYADGLWQSFDFPSQQKCADCHPKNPDRWKPTESQILRSDAGRSRRQVIDLKEENDLLRKEAFAALGSTASRTRSQSPDAPSVPRRAMLSQTQAADNRRSTALESRRSSFGQSHRAAPTAAAEGRPRPNSAGKPSTKYPEIGSPEPPSIILHRAAPSAPRPKPPLHTPQTLPESGSLTPPERSPRPSKDSIRFQGPNDKIVEEAQDAQSTGSVLLPESMGAVETVPWQQSNVDLPSIREPDDVEGVPSANDLETDLESSKEGNGIVVNPAMLMPHPDPQTVLINAASISMEKAGNAKPSDIVLEPSKTEAVQHTIPSMCRAKDDTRIVIYNCFGRKFARSEYASIIGN